MIPLLLSPPVAAAADLSAGAADYNAACARCHRDAAALVAELPVAGAARSEWLDRFLVRHRVPDPEVRADIIAWMLAQGSE